MGIKRVKAHLRKGKPVKAHTAKKKDKTNFYSSLDKQLSADPKVYHGKEAGNHYGDLTPYGKRKRARLINRMAKQQSKSHDKWGG